MSDTPRIGRRPLLAGLLASLVASPAKPGGPADQGIGGTGHPPDGDRGIGGTGIYGTITGFGSILVNFRRITYKHAVPVFAAGRRIRVRDLAVGQVVRVVCAGADLLARRIDVEYEVIGPVETADRERMRVLGQSIDIAGLAPPRPGAMVAVSGLRRPDGLIVASRIEPARGSRLEVTGPVELLEGRPRIGGLSLIGALPTRAGGRVRVIGERVGDSFHIGSAAPAPITRFRGPVGRLCVESFVEATGSELQLGPDLVVPLDAAAKFSAIQPGVTKRAVVDLSMKGGRLQVVGERAAPAADRPTPQASHPPPATRDRPTRPAAGRGRSPNPHGHGGD
jgi:hypothetical protein